MYCLVFRADVLVSFSDQHGLGLALEDDVGLAAGPRRPCSLRGTRTARRCHGVAEVFSQPDQPWYFLARSVSPRLLILPPAGQGILTLQWVTFGDLAVDADSGK